MIAFSAGRITVNGESLQKILSLPQLEKLTCKLEEEFPYIELSEIERLSHLYVTMISANPVFIGIPEAVKKMHRLQTLHIECSVAVSEGSILDLVCGVVNAAKSMEKYVVLKCWYPGRDRKLLHITKLSDHKADAIFEKDSQVFQLSLRFDYQETLFERVKEFVRNNLSSYNVFVLR